MVSQKSTKKGSGDPKPAAAGGEAGGEGCVGGPVSAVLIACAAMSHHIAVVGWNPPRTVPEDALRLKLGEIGIDEAEELEELRELIRALLPGESPESIDRLELKSTTTLEGAAGALSSGR